MKALRNFLFWIHMIAGFAAAIIIFLLSLSGLARAYERQVADLIDLPAVTRPAGAALPMSADALLVQAAKAHPGAPTQLNLFRDLSRPAEIRYGRMGALLLNPWTGEAYPQIPSRSRPFFEVFGRIHHALGAEMRNPTGRTFTDAANFVFLYLIVSGVFIWLPKSWNASNFKFRLLFKPGLKGRLRDWNWHHVLGIWALIPLFFISLTGVIFSYAWASGLLFSLTGSQPPAPPQPGQQMSVFALVSGQLAASAPVLPLENLSEAARAQFPGWRSLTIALPQPQAPVVDLTINQGGYNQPDKVAHLRLDRLSGQAIAIHRFADYPLGMQLRQLARGIHTGELFGLFGQTIAALVSLAAMILSWTGLALTIRRMRQALDKRNKTRKEAPVAA